MHKRRSFLIGSITLVLSSSLSRLHVRTLSSFVFQKEKGGRRKPFFVGGPNASDTNPGTAAAPFATIQAAAAVAIPGTEVRIRDGIYRETVTPPNSGTEESPIVFTADTRADGTLAEPVISGAEVIPDNAWTLTAAGDDPVLGGSGCYHATIELPSKSVAPLSDPKANILAGSVIISNQVFYKSEQVHLAAFPKKQVQDDLLDWSNYRDLSYMISPADVDGTTFLRGTIFKRLNGNTARWRERIGTPQELPDIDYTGAYVWVNFDFLPFSSPVTGSGTSSDKHGAYRYIDIRPSYPDAEEPHLTHRRADDWSGRKPMSISVFGVKGLLTGSNEWFYESATNRLFIRPPVSGSPVGVEYKARNWGFNLTGKSHISLKSLNFFACELALNGDSALPSQTEGILIDYCRFKYLNWWETKPRQDERFQDWPISAMRSNQQPYGMQTSIRLTAHNSIIRNSVIRQAAGDGVFLSGDNCTVENNWISDIGIRSGWSAAIDTAVPNPALITRNTVRRTFRSAFNNIGWDKEVSYNDFGHHMCLSSDGGAIYGIGRWEAPSDGSGAWGGKFGVGKGSGTHGGAFRGTVIHHNWLHSARNRWRPGRPAGVDPGIAPFGGMTNTGLYFDNNGDGAIAHHNVLWDNCENDTMPGTTNNSVEPPWEFNQGFDSQGNPRPWNIWRGKWNRYYYNTFASDNVPGMDFAYRVLRSSSLRSAQYARNPETVDNNIYMHNHCHVLQYPLDPADGLPGYRIKDSEAGARPSPNGNSRNPRFVNPGTPHQRFERYRPGDPLTGPNAPGGLRFQLQAASPARGIGVPVDGRLDNGRPPQLRPDGTPLPGGYTEVPPKPITGVDVPGVQAGQIDAGAYQTGVTPWVAGCDLHDEFIEGEPWKRQWN